MFLAQVRTLMGSPMGSPMESNLLFTQMLLLATKPENLRARGSQGCFPENQALLRMG